ncbi:LamG domain-containing protein [Fulvivirga ulvae]|uniref:LamG-like jellyroll fold domain-containing protein n=1 Tax=Fulvivirga ulvae TaxID=2904245 RepID=UPI001F1E3635|nr:LamG-like jellyroll fold domain-containing protein [Fulvivirga ulvae]UII31011.1 LamG domain-containing protein [Fulvivirga ulvae]
MKLRQNQKPTVKTNTSVVLKYAALGLLTIALVFSAVFIYNNFINIGDTRAEGDTGAIAGGGFAIHFDGEEDHIALPFSVDKQGLIDYFTVEAWINTASEGKKGDKIMPILDFDKNEYFSIYIDGKSGKVSFVTTDEKKSTDNLTSKEKVNDDNWHHIAAVYDGRDKYLYVDGKEVASSKNPHKGKHLGTGKERYGFIGTESDSEDRKKDNSYFKGSIDELRIWHDARSLSEIRRTLTEKLTGKEDKLYLYFPFNEGEGKIVKDAISGIEGSLNSEDKRWIASGIYIGDNSVYDYSNRSLTFKISGKGAVTVEITKGSPDGIHIYYVGQSPNYVTIPEGIQSLEEFYWGVYAMGNVEYSFSYDYDSYEGEFDPQAVELVERANSASDWVNSDAYRIAGQSQMLVANQKGTEYALASSAVVMPIELARFDAKAKGDDVEVTWTTSSELNNDFFTIERSSDGRDYSIVSTINGAGNSSEPLSYTYLDTKPLSSRAYYRLKQTDYDGKFEYFAPVMVEGTSAAPENVQLTVYPNPSLNQVITVVLEGLQEGNDASVAMMDLQGNAVFTENVISNGMGSLEVKIDPSNISGGNYLIVVTTAADKYTKQVILRK